eukprot:3316988-Lingulodinium_polyedra.AAC.1
MRTVATLGGMMWTVSREAAKYFMHHCLCQALAMRAEFCTRPAKRKGLSRWTVRSPERKSPRSEAPVQTATFRAWCILT